jgi:prophage regulatory protein
MPLGETSICPFTSKEYYMANQLVRASAAHQTLGIGKSLFYLWQKKGLIPQGIAMGPRVVVWPSAELDCIIRARVAGKSDDEVKQLVAELTAARAQGGAIK